MVLPLHENGLERDDEWHALKTLLLLCRYGRRDEARKAWDRLPPHLHKHPIGLGASRFLEDSSCDLDSHAVSLAQRDLPDAWVLLEKL